MPALGTSRELLERLGRVLVECGYSPRQILQEFAAICAKLKHPQREWNPATLGYIADLPHVLTHWHRDPDYLDDLGRPRPLSLDADGPSLSSLIARVYPSADPTEVVETLLRIKAIRRVRRRFVPSDRTVVYDDEAVRVHALLALLTILRTIDHNIHHAHDIGARLLERTVINPRIPTSRLDELHQELHQLCKQFAADIDALLLRNEVRPGSDEDFTSVTLGLYVGNGTLSRMPSAAVPSEATQRLRQRPRGRRAAPKIEK
jgi:hypothetical protein